MHIRIFGDPADAGTKLYAALCQLVVGRETIGTGAPVNIEICDPLTWGARTSAADVHIYASDPVRLAVPWATCNVAIVGAAASTAAPYPWIGWAATEIDLFAVIGGDAGHPPAGIPADRVFFLKAAAGAAIVTASPLRAYSASWRALFNVIPKRRHPPALPPALPKDAQPPRVGIITVTRDRDQWWRSMVQNVVGARWPHDRLQWIIVDNGGLAGRVSELREALPGINVRHLEVEEPVSIGAKRNAAVAAADPDINLFVCMDDDDHYPPDSIGRRIAWLADGRLGAAYCSTLPMYDTTRYISAMNVPPLGLSAGERISEATLAFTRQFWMKRNFPDVSMSEGDGFIVGREEQTVEIPPYGVIVSFIHRGNTSSRRIPADQPANGCHYGFSDEYFRLIHEAGDVQKVAAAAAPAAPQTTAT